MKKLNPLVAAPSTASFVAASDDGDDDVDVVDEVTQNDADYHVVAGEKIAALTCADRQADASSTTMTMEWQKRHRRRPLSLEDESCSYHHSAAATIAAARCRATRRLRFQAQKKMAAVPLQLLPAFTVTAMTTVLLMMMLLRDGSGGVAAAKADSGVVDHMVMMPSMWNHHPPNYRRLNGVEAVRERHSLSSATASSPQKRKRHAVGSEASSARKQRHVSQMKVPSEQQGIALGDDYERMLVEALQRDELRFEHSAHRQLSKSAPCRELVDRNATVLRSMARSTKQIETLRGGIRFPIAYCAAAAARIAPPLLAVAATSLDGRHATGATAADEGQCAVASKCATIYKWKRAEVETRRPAAATVGRRRRPPLSLDVVRKAALIDELAESVNGIRLLEAGEEDADGEEDGEKDEEVSVRVDDVLVPSGCTCVINALSTGFSDLPIIIF